MTYILCYGIYAKNACKEYKKNVKEFLTDLDTIPASDRTTINRRFDLFLEKHLFWGLWSLRLPNIPISDEQNLLCQRSRYHFSFFHDYQTERFFKRINMFSINRGNDIFGILFNYEPENVIFPHSGLENNKKLIKKYSSAPLSKAWIKKYEKALKIYNRIDEVKDNDEEWFKRIQEWDDEDFVIQNIEFKIGSNLRAGKSKRDIWKFYIEYLRLRNPNAMLGVYSRYCGYFLGDARMKKKYLNEAAKFGIFPGDELLDFQEFGSFPEERIQKLKKSLNLESCKTKLSLNSALLQQNLSFPDPIIHYLTQTQAFQNLHKFFMSCKYFFAKQKTPICHRFVIDKYQTTNPLVLVNQKTSPIIFDKQSLTISEISPEMKQLKNILVTNYFYSAVAKVFIEILPRIHKFAVKYLTIANHQILFKDYIFITESKTVKELKFTNVQIYYISENGTSYLVQLEEVMETLPNAYHIDLIHGFGEVFVNQSPISTNSQTFENVSALPRNTKLQCLGFRGCNETFNPISCFNFITNSKIFEERSHFKCLFNHNIDQNFKANSIAEFNNLLNAYNNKKENKIYCQIGYR